MAHAYLINQPVVSPNHAFGRIWALTRAMKKAGYAYKASSDGISVDASTTPNPASDLWGAGGLTGYSGSAASIGTKTLDDLTITGLSGMTSDSIGNFLTFSGAATSANNVTAQIVAFISSSSVKVRNPSGVASDANSGAISWTERNPLLDVYPSAFDSALAWCVFDGVKTLRLPVGTPTGTFLRGEKVTQAGTSAEGELLGYVQSTIGNYVVLLPRVGTFNTSGGLTGAVSGVTVTPTGGTLLTYVQEVVFAKSSDIFNGWVYAQRVEATSEAAQRFSVLAQTVASASEAPGNGSGGNGLPALGYAIRGAPGGSATNFLNNVYYSGASMGKGLGHMVCANTIGNPGDSPDGTFWLAQSMPGEGSNCCNGWGLFRLDDQETGEVDPFVWINSLSSASRTSATASGTYTWSATNSSGGLFYSPPAMQGWRARGYPAGDSFIVPSAGSQKSYEASYSNVCANPTDPDRIASHPDKPFPREPLYVACIAVGFRCRKGSVRWASVAAPTGVFYTLWDSGSFLQVNAPFVPYPALLIGPWNGTKVKYV